MTSHTTSKNNTHKIQILHDLTLCFSLFLFSLIFTWWFLVDSCLSPRHPLYVTTNLPNQLGFQGTQNCPPKAMVGYDLNEKDGMLGQAACPQKIHRSKSRKIRGFWWKYLPGPSFGVILVVDMHQMTHEFWSLFGPSSGFEQVVWGRRKRVKNSKHVPGPTHPKTYQEKCGRVEIPRLPKHLEPNMCFWALNPSNRGLLNDGHRRSAEYMENYDRFEDIWR